MRASIKATTTTQQWSKLNISLLWVYQGKTIPSNNGYVDTILTLAAWYVVKGKATVKTAKETVTAKAGEWIFLKPEAHHQYFSPETELISVRFRMEWPDGSQLFNNGLNLVVSEKNHPELRKQALRLNAAAEQLTDAPLEDINLLFRNLDVNQYISLEKEVLIWSEMVCSVFKLNNVLPQIPSLKDPRSQAILEHLDSWPLHEPFSAKTLSSKVGMSTRNLERMVFRIIGSTAKAYIDQHRLNHSLELLRKKGTSIKQIATETGFQHSSSFCAWFKKKTGRYPSDMAQQFF